MRVDLRELVPNPFRDLTVDPILDDEDIRESIRKHDFWGGTVVRKVNGSLQIAAGHVRVHEAINCGITEADLFVSDKISDEDMVRIYAVENATQRGVENNAIAGSIIAAIRLNLRRQFFSELFNKNNGLDDDKANTGEITSVKPNPEGARGRYGLGREAILATLGDIPGFTDYMVQQQLTVLKLSGDYDRVVNELVKEAEAAYAAEIARLEEEAKKRQEEEERQRIEKELAEKRSAAEAVEKTKKETENAAKKRAQDHGTTEPLDLVGISKHLKHPRHINTFRRLVLADNVRKMLPKESQAALAEALVKKAEEADREMSSTFLTEHLFGMVSKVREINRREERRFTKLDWESKMRQYMEDFSRHCRGMLSAGTDIADLNKSRPKGVTLYATAEFKNAIESVSRIMDRLKEEKII